MTDMDFSYCVFIKEQLCYLTYDEFCRNAKILKIFYDSMTTEQKIFYKWYVYANIHMDEHHKNLIWNYLNNIEVEYYLWLLDGRKTNRVR